MFHSAVIVMANLPQCKYFVPSLEELSAAKSTGLPDTLYSAKAIVIKVDAVIDTSLLIRKCKLIGSLIYKCHLQVK